MRKLQGKLSAAPLNGDGLRLTFKCGTGESFQIDLSADEAREHRAQSGVLQEAVVPEADRQQPAPVPQRSRRKGRAA